MTDPGGEAPTSGGGALTDGPRRRARKLRQGGDQPDAPVEHRRIGTSLNYGPVITALFFESAACGATTRGMTGLGSRRAGRGAEKDDRAAGALAEAAQGDDLTPELCRLGRLRLGWTVEKLAIAAGLAPQTVAKFELAGCRPRSGTVIALRKTLRTAGAFGRGARP